MDIKQALKDHRFRDSLPLEVREDVAKYLQNPGCPCNVPLYRKILKDCQAQLAAYFPGKEVTNEAAEIKQLAENHWTVINCKAHELESRLRKLAPGRKQLAVARFDDEITVIVNELDVLY